MVREGKIVNATLELIFFGRFESSLFFVFFVAVQGIRDILTSKPAATGPRWR